MDRLSCDLYNSELILIVEDIESLELMSSSFDQELYDLCEEAEKDHFETSIQIGGGRKKIPATTDLIEEERAKKRTKIHVETPSTSTSSVSINQNVSTENNDKIECSVCHVFVSRKYLTNHFKSNTHKINVLRSDEELTNVQIIESAFGNRILTYRIKSNINSDQPFETPELFLENIKDLIYKLLERCIIEHFAVKVNFILNANFTQETKNLFNTFDFQMSNYVICRGDDTGIIFSSIVTEITNKISNFEKKDSGWSLVKIKHLDMNVNKFNPLHGSSYIDLPSDIKYKKAVINVQNNDNECFRWAVLSGLYPVKNNCNRVTAYMQHKQLRSLTKSGQTCVASRCEY